MRQVSGGWTLPLNGRVIDQLWFDFAVTLVVDGSETVRINTPMTLLVGANAVRLDPADPAAGTGLVALLGLHRAVIDRAVVSPDGSLTIDLDGDRRLLVDPSPDYQAWEARGGLPPTTEEYVVSSEPGGAIVVG